MSHQDLKDLICAAPIILLVGLKFLAIPGAFCMAIAPFSPESWWSGILTGFLYSIPVFWFGGIYIGLRAAHKKSGP
jgi:ABC-type dipeptide/oligopeptide/nickel transport system permease component